MSLLIPNVGEVELLRRGLFGNGGTITGVTNASPGVITTGASHGLTTGNAVNISGVGGATGVNGSNLVVFVASSTTFSVSTAGGTAAAPTLTPVNTPGVYTSGGTWSLAGVEGLSLKLFSSSTTPAETDTAGTYTVLTDGVSGYAVQTLTSKLDATAGWTTPASGSPTGSWSAEASVAEATSPQIVYNFSGSLTINGYIVVGATSTTLFWAENFGSTKNVVSGDTLTMTPRLGQS